MSILPVGSSEAHLTTEPPSRSFMSMFRSATPPKEFWTASPERPLRDLEEVRFDAVSENWRSLIDNEKPIACSENYPSSTADETSTKGLIDRYTTARFKDKPEHSLPSYAKILYNLGDKDLKKATQQTVAIDFQMLTTNIENGRETTLWTSALALCWHMHNVLDHLDSNTEREKIIEYLKSLTESILDKNLTNYPFILHEYKMLQERLNTTPTEAPILDCHMVDTEATSNESLSEKYHVKRIIMLIALLILFSPALIITSPIWMTVGLVYHGIQSWKQSQAAEAKQSEDPYIHEVNAEIGKSRMYRVARIAVIVLLLPVWIVPAVAISPLLLVGYASYLLYNRYFENDQHDDCLDSTIGRGTDTDTYKELRPSN